MIAHIAQIVGAISVLLLFFLELLVASRADLFRRSGRIVLLWTSVYVFFLFFLRLISLFQLGTPDQLRIISGFSALIPLVAVGSHLLFSKNLSEHDG